MTELNLTEATMLQRFLEDPDGLRALDLFFQEQANYYSNQCKDLLLADQEKEAMKAAHQSLAYAGAMNLLADFIEKQMRRHA